MGFFYSPKVFDITNDVDLTQKEKEDLVYHHLCPHCNGWCEAWVKYYIHSLCMNKLLN